MDDIIGTILVALLGLLIFIWSWGNGFDKGQISVASERWSCAIEGDVREDRTIETEWVCTLNDKEKVK